MKEPFAPPAADVPSLLAAGPATAIAAATPRDFVAALLAERRRFGITRVGSIGRLDRLRLPVVQVVRALALSNAVAQGKGLDLTQAALSALMEALETWAGERIPTDRLAVSTARDLGDSVRALYAGAIVDGFDAGWDRLRLRWIEGYDLIGRRTLPVPAALVDTVYTLPSPHPVGFPRTTTGLAAGRSARQALVHAGLEVLERHAVAMARRRPGYFDEWQVDAATVDGPLASQILARVKAAGLAAGIWLVPSDHGLPTYWCHVVEEDEHRELAPLPAQGFGCDFTHDGALARALLEACQARLTAIGGAREDIARLHYPDIHDRERLRAWRQRISAPRRPIAFPRAGDRPPDGPAAPDRILGALEAAGAAAAVVVPLFSDPARSVHVLRLVAPPLRHNLEGHGHD